MAQHPNFYENLKEANMRLKGTIVMYDGEPYYVMCITNHKPDGIFRVWLDPIGREGGMNIHKEGTKRPPYDKAHTEDMPGGNLGQMMDTWFTKNPNCGVERKMMNSPKFNKFRPFPMGMINITGRTNFVERHPTRKVEQGLTKASIIEKPVNFPGKPPEVKTDILSPEFRSCILGQYPDGKECLDRMLDPKIGNSAVGFDRNFAIVRGPLNTLFIGYKADVVGFLPDNNFKALRLGKEFVHTKEAIGDLGVFDKIIV